MLPERYAPSDDLAAQLTFALKWEGVNLAVLDALFRSVPASLVADAVRTAPTGAYMRRLWFLYEWLTGQSLDLPDLGKVRAVPVVDPELQLAIEGGELSARHRVRNNLPGTPAFCPMVRRTESIVAWQRASLGDEARRVIGRTRSDVMARAAAFLLLSDSGASYRIEGEKPSRDRLRRWGQTIARAGTIPLSVMELERLQREVIGDDRFVHLGLREQGGFVGEHDRHTHTPIPEHISARPDDLESLVEGIASFDERAGRGGMDAVAAAAAVAFGFVYVHPFEDGNGRVHRWLIHHVLAAAGFAAP
ncbi:MAG: cell filamentation protein Fic, partial [Gemmatimonadetes bacterium]|nr:cell filamentation protein Fic [Gemmatimonadota bacterium]